VVSAKLLTRITLSFLAVAPVLPNLAGCTAPEAPSGVATAAIIGGKIDAGDPAVVLLASYPADQSTLDTCTAVLIAPAVLLTAAHCVDAANHPGHTFGIFTGPDATAYETVGALIPKLVAVQEVHAHPDYDPAPPFHADIGVVVLAAPLDVTPLPIERAPLEQAIVGQPARIVGYGQTVYGEYNVSKHQATTVVAGLPAQDTVLVGDAAHRSCVGDSGGPALVMVAGTETVIGVDSYSDTTGCIEPAHYQRTDVYQSFIDVYAPPDGAGGSGGGGGSGGSTTAGVGGGSGGDSGGEGGSDEESAGGCAVARGSSGRTSPLALVVPLALAAGLRRRRRRANHRGGGSRAHVTSSTS